MPCHYNSNRISPSALNYFRLVMPRQIRNKRAFSLVEIMVAIAIISILSGIAIGGFRFYIKKAYNVTIKHDLKNFIIIQKDFYTENNRYHGTDGDYIQGGDTVTGPLVSGEFKFRPSKGVKIEIISGDGANPEGPPAFTARSSHEKATKTFSYNFVTAEMTEGDN